QRHQRQQGKPGLYVGQRPAGSPGIGVAHRRGHCRSNGDQRKMSAYLTQSLMASDRPTAALAQWCSALSDAPLPADVAHQTVRHVLDTLAACAAGMGRPLVQDAIVLERTLNPVAGEVPIFGGPQRWTVLEAASLMAIA